MTLCPVAVAVGCKRCPIFALCPAKSIIGDASPKSDSDLPRKSTSKPAARSKARKTRR